MQLHWQLTDVANYNISRFVQCGVYISEISVVIVHSGNTLNRAYVKNNGPLVFRAYLRLCGSTVNKRVKGRASG